MTRLLASAALLAVMPMAALAADASVVGDWLVKDGFAHIRIDNCGGRVWGIVVWEKTPGLDVENPDPAKKSRPTLGMPVLMGLAPAKEPGKWSGEIYNSNNGKMYGATIGLADENTLDLEGCLVWPLCQTQKWTRVKTRRRTQPRCRRSRTRPFRLRSRRRPRRAQPPPPPRAMSASGLRTRPRRSRKPTPARSDAAGRRNRAGPTASIMT